MRTLSTAAPQTLLYDAECGLCAATARWLDERTNPAALRILPLASAAGDPRLAPLVAGRDLASTLHLVVADGEVLTGARAVLAAARTVPRWGALARLADNWLGHALLEPAYRRVAANRHRIGRWLGLAASCAVPATTAGPPARAALPFGFEPTDRSVGR